MNLKSMFAVAIMAVLVTTGCVDNVRDYDYSYNQYPNQYYTYGIEDRYGDRHYHHHKHQHTIEVNIDADGYKAMQDVWGVKHHYHNHNQNFGDQMPDWNQHKKHHHKSHGGDYTVKWKVKHNYSNNW